MGPEGEKQQELQALSLKTPEVSFFHRKNKTKQGSESSQFAEAATHSATEVF